MNTSPLTEKQRAFCDAYAGVGSGTAAARAAGYGGGKSTLQVRASQLLKDQRIRDRIETRLGAAPAPEPVAIETPPAAARLVKGRGRGTQTERIELLMSIGRSKKEAARDRINAIGMAAELEGERRRTNEPLRLPLLPVAPPAPAAAPVPTGKPTLALVYNEQDERLRG